MKNIDEQLDWISISVMGMSYTQILEILKGDIETILLKSEIAQMVVEYDLYHLFTLKVQR